MTSGDLQICIRNTKEKVTDTEKFDTFFLKNVIRTNAKMLLTDVWFVFSNHVSSWQNQPSHGPQRAIKLVRVGQNPTL